MANALFVDALIGYQYYLEKRGKVTLDEVNRYLFSRQRGAIAHRTFAHYRKLMAYGFRTYIPINKFDVFHSLNKLEAAADRRRYTRYACDIEAEISKDGIWWIPARVIDRSLVGFGIVTGTRFPVSPVSSGWVRLPGYAILPVVFVWRQHHAESTRIGVRALEFIANYRLREENTLPSRPYGTLVVTRTTQGAIPWLNLYTVLTRIDQVIYSSTSLIETIADTLRIEVDIAYPMLDSIEFGSPGILSVLADLGVAKIVQVAIEKLPLWGLQKKQLTAEVRGKELANVMVQENHALDLQRGQFEISVQEVDHQVELQRKQLENQLVQADITRKGLENINLAMETMRNALELKKASEASGLSDVIIQGIIVNLSAIVGTSVTPSQATGLFQPGSPERGIVDRHLLPAVADLVAGDDPNFEMQVKPGNEDSSDPTTPVPVTPDDRQGGS